MKEKAQLDFERFKAEAMQGIMNPNNEPELIGDIMTRAIMRYT